jgi:hypothetical protein
VIVVLAITVWFCYILILSAIYATCLAAVSVSSSVSSNSQLANLIEECLLNQTILLSPLEQQRQKNSSVGEVGGDVMGSRGGGGTTVSSAAMPFLFFLFRFFSNVLVRASWWAVGGGFI